MQSEPSVVCNDNLYNIVQVNDKIEIDNEAKQMNMCHIIEDTQLITLVKTKVMKQIC